MTTGTRGPYDPGQVRPWRHMFLVTRARPPLVELSFPTFLGPDVADELHLAAPGVEGVQDAVGVSGCGVRQDVLISALLPAKPGDTVPPEPD